MHLGMYGKCSSLRKHSCQYSKFISVQGILSFVVKQWIRGLKQNKKTWAYYFNCCLDANAKIYFISFFQSSSPFCMQLHFRLFQLEISGLVGAARNWTIFRELNLLKSFGKILWNSWTSKNRTNIHSLTMCMGMFGREHLLQYWTWFLKLLLKIRRNSLRQAQRKTCK